ncbi:MAG: PIG-L deacetylase family protein [Nitriliruptor sp.]|uniref:PIG-L deacetylase family protein n=1 Tax=Nitriliruptor sp. TaxID=2448056 RepID=UPI0034A07AA1
MTDDGRLPWLDERGLERVLCVAAHPDDLEYGTAAAVSRWVAAGIEVTYLLVTSGEAGIGGMSPADVGPLREQEERDGAREVGVDVVEFLAGYGDGTVEAGLALRRDLARVIRRHRPQLVTSLTHRERFVGGGTNQADHRVVGLACVDAAADAGNRWIFPELIDEGHEPWSGVGAVALSASPEPTHAVDVTGHLDAAVRSLEAHRAYLEGLGDAAPDPEVMLGMMLEGGGGPEGVDHALTFEVFDR